jgi:large repetitive protein
MKRISILLIFLIPLLSNAQKQGNNWYFGLQAGLDFSSSTPVILTDGQTGTDFPISTNNQEGTSCISDSSGNLLFYTGGKTIWNRNHLPMPNGSGIMGGVSSTQSSLIVPLPGSDSVFYVFTSDEFQNYSGSNIPKGYRYSVIDMCLEKGDGDVIVGQKNILLCDSSTEKLAACVDTNGGGYWVVGHKMFSDEFYSWHLTSGGITNTVVSKIGTIHGWKQLNSTWNEGAAQGQMAINANGTKLALAISNFDPAYLDLFDFNNNTGTISNFCHIVIDSALGKRIHGVEFSPDGSKLYATLREGSKSEIYQYNVVAGGCNCDSIKASSFKLFQSTNSPMYFGIQLAPNNKIYIVVSCDLLGCINYPDMSFLAADFDSSAISPGNTWCYMLPSFVAGYKYHNGIPHCSGDGIEEQMQKPEIIIFPNPSSGEFQIENSKQIDDIRIYNALGAQVYEKTVNSEQLTVNLNIPDGIYFVQVICKEGTVARKVIIQK